MIKTPKIIMEMVRIICAFCKQNKQGTNEHVIPDGLLNLYPQHDINFTPKGNFKSNDGITIKDVCSDCNNIRLSALDNYGVSMIKENFFSKEFTDKDTYNLSYDYEQLSRWLLKIAYNKSRVDRENIDWFRLNMDFILNGSILESTRFSLFGGFSVNMSPMPEACFETKPLCVYREPLLLPYGPPKLWERNDTTCKPIRFEGTNTCFIFRFSSAMFLLFLWDVNMDESIKAMTEKLITRFFPYTLLNNNDTNVVLTRVTDSLNYFQPQIVHGVVGQKRIDELTTKLIGNRDPIATRKENEPLFKTLNKEGKVLNEALMFPGNKKVQKEWKQIFGNPNT